MRRRLVIFIILGVIACLGGVQAATANTEALNPCALLLSVVDNDPYWADKVPVHQFEKTTSDSWSCALVSRGTPGYALLVYFFVARSAALAHVDWKHVYDGATAAGQNPTLVKGFPVNEAYVTQRSTQRSVGCGIWWRKGRYWGNLGADATGADGPPPFGCLEIHDLFMHLMRRVPHR